MIGDGDLDALQVSTPVRPPHNPVETIGELAFQVEDGLGHDVVPETDIVRGIGLLVLIIEINELDDRVGLVAVQHTLPYGEEGLEAGFTPVPLMPGPGAVVVQDECGIDLLCLLDDAVKDSKVPLIDIFSREGDAEGVESKLECLVHIEFTGLGPTTNTILEGSFHPVKI